jgi:hypothetical protein
MLDQPEARERLAVDEDAGGGDVGADHDVLAAGRALVVHAGDEHAGRRVGGALVPAGANAQETVGEGEDALLAAFAGCVVAVMVERPAIVAGDRDDAGGAGVGVRAHGVLDVGFPRRWPPLMGGDPGVPVIGRR